MPAPLKAVVQRALSDRLMLVATSLTILLATTLAAASPIYADAVTLASLHRILHEGASGSSLEVVSRITPDHLDEYDEVVNAAVGDHLVTAASVSLKVTGTAFALPDQPEEGVVQLASIQYLENVEQFAELVDGEWAGSAGDRAEVAVLAQVAAHLGLSVGDVVDLTSRHDDSIESVRVSGIYEVADPDDLYWHGDALVATGVSEAGSFRNFGPFLTTRETVLDRFTRTGAEIRWRVIPVHDSLTVEAIPDQRRAVDGLTTELDEASDGNIRVNTQLGSILADAEQSVVATRASVLMLTLQLGILAGYAMVHAAGLLVDSRSVETGLLRARGAGNRQIMTAAALEGLLLVIPAVLLAPTLASLLLRLLGRFGPLAAIGLTFEPLPNNSAYLLAAIGGLVAIVLLSLPAYRASRTFNESLAEKSRQETRTAAHRAGWDVALLALTVLGFWQLSAHGPRLSATLRSSRGFDPLLVAVPALGMLGGAVLALRVVPMLASLLERVTTRGRSAVRALTAWQIARRPRRYTRSALLLIIAISIGVFVAAYSQTWTRSQVDQAAFRAGADMRVQPRRGSTDIAEMHLRAVHEAILGVESSMPVLTRSRQLFGNGPTATFFAIDAAVATDTIAIRPDLVPGGFGKAIAGLVDGRPDLNGVPLPGTPTRIEVEIALTSDAPCGTTVDPEDLAPYFPDLTPNQLEAQARALNQIGCLEPTIDLVVQDAGGFLFRLPGVEVPVNEGPVTAAFPVTRELADGTVVTANYPLSVVSIEVTGTSSMDLKGEIVGEVSMRILAGDDQRTAVVIPETDSWEGWVAEPAGHGLARIPSVEVSTPETDGTIRATLRSGSVGLFNFSVPELVFGMWPQRSIPTEIPAVVTSTLLTATGSAVGDTIDIGQPFGQQSGVITATIDLFPSVAAGQGEAVILDLPTAQAMGYSPGYPIVGAAEYWLRVDPSAASEVAETLLAPPLSSIRVFDRQREATALATDPLALSTIAAMSLGFMAALAFAVVAFTVNVIVLARERHREITLLRALGLSLRQVRRWLFLEQGALVVASLILGTSIGMLLSTVVLPLITVTQDGSVPIPEPIVVYPVSATLVLNAVVLVLMLVVVGSLFVSARRAEMTGPLRLGDE